MSEGETEGKRGEEYRREGRRREEGREGCEDSGWKREGGEGGGPELRSVSVFDPFL